MHDFQEQCEVRELCEWHHALLYKAKKNMACRFASATEKDIERLLDEKDSQNTKRSTKVAKELLFSEYLKEKNTGASRKKKDLAQVLKSFYGEARKKDGSSYSMGSLKTLGFGLNRHFKAVRGVDIMNEEEFSKANKVFAAKCVQLKKDGQAKVQHKPPIADADLKKVYESGVFSTDHSKSLLNKVFFEIMLCFCRRGGQNLRQLKRSDFVVKTDSTGANFVSKVLVELTKNHTEDDEAKEGGIMYATGGLFCPVASFEKYLQHLNPQNEFLFQCPKKKLTPDCDVWYNNMVVGERSLGEMMKQISKQAGLQRITQTIPFELRP